MPASRARAVDGVAVRTRRAVSSTRRRRRERRTAARKPRAVNDDDDDSNGMDNREVGESAAAMADSASGASADGEGRRAGDLARELSDSSGKRRVRRAESTDAVATFMTRRFGLKGGLAWLGVLLFGVLSEQIKTRRETREAVENTKDVDASQRRTVELPSGVSYVELTRGGGELVANQYLCAAKVTVRPATSDVVVFDTSKSGRQVVWSYGGKLGGAITRGVEEGVRGMRQGGRRVITVPARLAYGSEGAGFPDGKIDPDEDVVYDVTLTRVSIPPS